MDYGDIVRRYQEMKDLKAEMKDLRVELRDWKEEYTKLMVKYVELEEKNQRDTVALHNIFEALLKDKK